MNVHEMKAFLRKVKPERIKISSKVRFKVEHVHGVNLETVMKNLENPVLLKEVEEQQSRRSQDQTYGLLFEPTKRKKLFVVITSKRLEKKLYLVTAFPSTKKAEKLIKRPKIRR